MVGPHPVRKLGVDGGQQVQEVDEDSRRTARRTRIKRQTKPAGGARVLVTLLRILSLELRGAV